MDRRIRDRDSDGIDSEIGFFINIFSEMLSRYINELRWVEYGEGMAFVQRSWMDGDAESSADWANMTANFYIGAIFPKEGGKAQTIAASWAAVMLGEFSVPEDIAQRQAIDGLKENGEDLTLWLTENDVPDLD